MRRNQIWMPVRRGRGAHPKGRWRHPTPRSAGVLPCTDRFWRQSPAELAMGRRKLTCFIWEMETMPTNTTRKANTLLTLPFYAIPSQAIMQPKSVCFLNDYKVLQCTGFGLPFFLKNWVPGKEHLLFLSQREKKSTLREDSEHERKLQEKDHHNEYFYMNGITKNSNYLFTCMAVGCYIDFRRAS